jgi:anti-sigma B factor antagonist
MSHLNVHQFEGITVVEFTRASLMDTLELQQVGAELYQLVDEQDLRQIVLDFEKVQFVSSQAIGILMGLHNRLAALKKSALVLCSLSERLKELLTITRLDRVLKIKPSQREAVRSLRGY